MTGDSTVLLSIWIVFLLLGGGMTAQHLYGRRILRRERARSEQLYHQLESLFSLFHLLPLRRPLPPMRNWAVSPDFARILLAEVMEQKPSRVLELGSGVSTIVTGYGLEKINGGAIVSLEHDATFAETSRREVERHGLSERCRILHAPLELHTLQGRTFRWYSTKAFEGIEDIDLLIVDGPPANIQSMARYPALPVLIGKLAPSAVVLIDDAARPDEQRMIAEWSAQFPGFKVEWISAEKGTCRLRRKAPPG